MKKQTTLWSSVSILVVGILLITAFTRGRLQLWLYIGAFGIWGIWMLAKFLTPYVKRQKDLLELKRLQKQREQEMQRADALTSDSSVGLVLLRHVNHRISAYLKSVYPEAAWEWCEENPERLIAKGGSGRIRLFNIPDYNYAEVQLDRQANITCSMLKIVPISEVRNQGAPKEEKPPKNTVDPQIWYEVHGRQVLESLISDLESRGYDSLLIKENGEVCVQHADSEIKKSVVENMPERVYWPSLTKVFERNGIAAAATEAGVVLSW